MFSKKGHNEKLKGLVQLGDPLLNQKMKWNKSEEIMPFVGSLDYETSRKFYSEIGFIVESGNNHCKVKVSNKLSFWLQDYSNKEWLNNSMIFLNVPYVVELRAKLVELNIEKKYKNVKISEIKEFDWGDEFFMHDPSGVLWHLCEYGNSDLKWPADNIE